MLVHTVTVEAFTGVNAKGDVFGTAVPMRCYVEEVSRLISTVNTEEVSAGTTGTFSSSTTVYAQRSDQAKVPVSSRVTLPSGHVSKVLQVDTFDTGSLRSGMDHIVIHLA